MNRGEQAEWCPKCQAWVMPVATVGWKSVMGYTRPSKWQCPTHWVETVEDGKPVPYRLQSKW